MKEYPNLPAKRRADAWQSLVHVCRRWRSLVFGSPRRLNLQLYWKNRSLPLPKRSILPVLHEFRFKGITEYLEELVTSINTPQLDEMEITFFNQIDFDTPQLAQFINHRTPAFRARDEAHLKFDEIIATVKLRYQTFKLRLDDPLIDISCIKQDWQVSSIEQVCNSLWHALSTVEDLHITRLLYLVQESDAIENTLWLQLLLPFIAVKNLYLSEDCAPGITAALQELVGGGITEILPSLQNIFVAGPEPLGLLQENIGQFAAERFGM